VGKLLQGDGYSLTTSPSPGDVAIYANADSPTAHSAAVLTTGSGGVESVMSKPGIRPAAIVPPADPLYAPPAYYTR
jgi:hypothetical protein